MASPTIPSRRETCPRTRKLDRFWSDTSCGTQTYFDYPQNLAGTKDVPMIDDAADGITATLFRNRILYLNPTDKEITSRSGSASPTSSRACRPAQLLDVLALPPHSIKQTELR